MSEIRSLTPSEVCKCGSVEISNIGEEHDDDGITFSLSYECDVCEKAWVVIYKMVGVLAL